jgi:acetyltransferase
VLKIRSPEITHKTDCGGVALNLTSASEVQKEALAMAERVRASHPNAGLSGFTVQQMISRPNAVEIIVGVAEDRTFGPVVLFGHGGVAVQAFNDSALELPPVTEELARAQISRTRVSKLLHGFRNRPPADISAIADVLVRVSHLVSNHAEICELDINPLITDEHGVLALDARVRVQGTSSQPSDRLAILPV